MNNKAYRKAFGGTSVATTVIIVLLVLIIVTLCAVIARDMSNDRKTEVDTSPVTTEKTTVTEKEDTETQAVLDISRYDVIKCSESELTQGPLVLVNRENAYAFSDSVSLVNLFNNKDRRYTVSSSEITLQRDAFLALGKLTEAFYSETSLEILQITAGYRTKQQQEEFYNSMVSSDEDSGYYEFAGYSDHHTGYAFDVKLYLDDGTSLSYSKNAEEYASFIVDNYHKYGFIMRYPGDKTEYTGIISEGNHFRYVGMPHSVYMHENDLCLEEYISYIKNFPVTSPLQVLTGGKTYYVYYTRKTGDVTDVYVPNFAEYTVSGNNTDGFIVTYCE